jgi:hypothetical protein
VRVAEALAEEGVALPDGVEVEQSRMEVLGETLDFAGNRDVEAVHWQMVGHGDTRE